MTDWPDYELIDFGEGRKLERFGPVVFDRPCPTAVNAAKQNASAWRNACSFAGDRAAEGKWTRTFKPFAVAAAGSELELAPLPSGQVGLFPEQFANWRWITRQVERAKKPVRVLNLFAYTGGSTLAAAIAGAELTHVDAAKSMVTRARRNVDLSGLAEHPIRWIVEDATKFCQREVKRGNQYDAVILDPPSYGHGPKGESWSIKRDLLPLLELCGQLTADRRQFILCTCHTPGIGAAELSAYLSDGIFGHCGQPPQVGTLYLRTSDGRKLASGEFARWPR
ncbi:MAG: class I SAM-dependent methyltransferase [Planctomycetota bacterium]